MKSTVLFFVFIPGFIGCSKETVVHLKNQNGSIESHRCFCQTSAYRYLIVVNDTSGDVYYNPVNLSDDYKDQNYKIVFSGNLLNDSSTVYHNLPNDALIVAFKARNIKLTNIKKTS
jgi:hypothetical protein